jgi:putative heme-binding domain-containing protein
MIRLLSLLTAIALLTPHAARGEDVKPIRALLITGGCCHDYAEQKKILTEGTAARINIEWTIAHQGGSATNSRIPIYVDPNWADGYDIVIHNECFADVGDPAWTDRILKPHQNGLPAIVVHCAMHCYRDRTDEWFKFLGVTSRRHGSHFAFDVVNKKPDHPIMEGFGEKWTTPKGELYIIEKVWENTTPLATAFHKETNKDEPCIWTNLYMGKTRVVGTTVGHYNEEMSDPVFLNYLSNGILWATDKLKPEYKKPAAKVSIDEWRPKGAVGQKVQVPVNLAKGKKATATGSQEGHPPEHAVDENNDTRWCSPDGSPGQSWQVDLGKPEEVKGVRILWEQDSLYQYKVEGSADGKAWTMLSDQTKSEPMGQEHLLKFDAPNTQFVKISITGLRGGSWGSFYEAEVFGKETVEKIIYPSVEPKAVQASPTDPSGLLRGIKAPSDFEVTLFAAPPEISYPTCLAAAPNGDLYVGVDLNGSLGADDRKGKIIKCVDENGDGKADKFTTFAEMDSPRGMVWDDEVLYVQHPPKVVAYYDADHDGVSERNETLVDGIGFDLKFRGADHTTNGMTLGIDGWLYIAIGDYGFVKATGKDGANLQFHGGGVVRVRTDGSGLEVVSRGQRNIYDVAVDPLLNMFTRDNTNDGGGWNVRLSHIVPTGQYGYPSLFINFPDEIIQPLADYGGGSPCGSLAVDESTLPPPFGKTFYTCDWGRSVIYRHPLVPNGAGFQAEQAAFVEIPRPTDMEIDASGRIFIASWKDGGFSFSKPDVGFVIQMRPAGTPTMSIGEAHKLTDDQLLAAVASDGHIKRLWASREILRRGYQPTMGVKLADLARLTTLPIEARVAALFTLSQLGGEPVKEFLLKLVELPELREFALKALADDLRVAKTIPSTPFVAGLKDKDPRVRLQAAIGLGRLGRRDQAADLIALLDDVDPLVRHVTVKSLVQLDAGDACLKAYPTASPNLATGCLQVLHSLHESSVVEGLLSLNAAATDPVRKLALLRTLARLYSREAEWKGQWWTTRPDTTGPYFHSETWQESERIATALKAGLQTSDAALLRGLLVELRRHKIDFPEVGSLIVKAVQTDPSFQETAVELLSNRDPVPAEAVGFLEQVASNESSKPAVRANALRGLQRSSKSPEGFDAALRGFTSVARMKSVPDEIVRVRDEFLRDGLNAERLESVVKLLGGTPPERQVGYGILIQVAGNARLPQAPRAVAEKEIEKVWNSPERAVPFLAAAIDTHAEQYVLQYRALLKSENAEIKKAAENVIAKLQLDANDKDANGPLIGTLDLKEVAKRAEPTGGDAKKGARLFLRQGCIACHTVSPQDPVKGPYLGDIAVRYKRPELVESVLTPNAKIAQGFATHVFVLNSGKVLNGFIAREAADEVEVRDTAGVSTLLKTGDIEERQSQNVSMMPVGLVHNITVDQFRNLMAYLETLKTSK